MNPICEICGYEYIDERDGKVMYVMQKCRDGKDHIYCDECLRKGKVIERLDKPFENEKECYGFMVIVQDVTFFTKSEKYLKEINKDKDFLGVNFVEVYGYGVGFIFKTEEVAKKYREEMLEKFNGLIGASSVGKVFVPKEDSKGKYGNIIKMDGSKYDSDNNENK